MDDPTSRAPDAAEPRADPADQGVTGPLTAETARETLDRAAEFADSGEWDAAAIHYRRVIGFPSAQVSAAALLGLGQALYRLDRESSAMAAWEAILEMPETPSTYRAWREVAAARVRDGDLQGAIAAYRQADRRAPAQDKGEIAARLGWLAKETGNSGAARRYFAKSRGGGPAIPLTWIIVGLTVVVSFSAFSSAEGQQLYALLQLDKFAVAAGEYWRLWTVTLLHGSFLHLGLNMYMLYLLGPVVEQLYGARLFLVFYLLTAASGSVASFTFGGDIPSVGASGAIFGLVGVLLAASRIHNPVLDSRGRALTARLGFLVLINLVFGFSVSGIDNAAHIGGLLGGLWLGYLLVPGNVPTLSRIWQRPDGADRTDWSLSVLRSLGVVALVVVIIVGVVIGTDARRSRTAVEVRAVAPGAAAVVAVTPARDG